MGEGEDARAPLPCRANGLGLVRPGGNFLLPILVVERCEGGA